MPKTGDGFGDFSANENDAMAAYTFANKVKKKVADLGLGNYQRPKLDTDHESIFPGVRAGQVFDGRLPTVIRKLSLDQLSALYSLYSNWYGYVTNQTMVIAAERSEALRQKEFMINNLKKYYRYLDPAGKKTPEPEVVDAVKTDKRFIVVHARYEELNALFEILEAMRKVADQDMKVISREVTIQQEKVRKELLLGGFKNRAADRDFDEALSSMDGDNGRQPYGTVPNDTETFDREQLEPDALKEPAALRAGVRLPQRVRTPQIQRAKPKG